MKKTVNLFLVSSIMVLLATFISAEEKTEGLELWTSIGMSDATIISQESVPGGNVSKNKFDVDGNDFVGFGCRYQFVNSSLEKLSMTFNYTSASSLDGDSDDSLWVSPNYTTVSSLSVYEVEAETDDLDLNLGWKLYSSANQKAAISYLIGYYSTDYSFEERNLQSLTGSTVTIGHISDYDLEMRSIYLGVEGNFLLANDKLRLHSSLKYMPKLRADSTITYDTSALLVEQECDGDGYLFDFGVTFVPAQNWSIGLTFKKTYLDSDGDAVGFTLDRRVDYYGVTQSEVTDDDYYGWADVDELSIDSFDTELRVGYIF